MPVFSWMPEDVLALDPVLVVLLFKLLLELSEDEPEDLLPEFELLLTACPVTKPCKISARFLALAYFRRKTFKPPRRSAAGTSKVSIIWRTRFRVAGSPLIIIRLVRLSAITRTREPRTSLAPPVAVMDSISPIISSA